MTTTKPFDPTKPVRTRAGAAARILCTDARGTSGNILALVDRGEYEAAYWFYQDGRYLRGAPHSLDLINIPERHVRWANVTSHGTAYLYESEWAADSHRSPNCIACIRLEFEEGEGLE